MKHRRSAFTLLEMVVVLTIVALIAGGVVGARSMLRNAQIRTAVGEYDAYLKSIKEFQDKYQALPGDMNTATTLWGTDPLGCPNNTYSATPKTRTCNGDGNGRIGASTIAGVLSSTTEWWRAWQHLSNAELIDGAFTGVPGWGGGVEANIGLNVPASKLDGGGWTLFYLLMTSDGALWGDQYGHVLTLGKAFPSGGTYTIGAILTPTEALSLDQKIDDGAPGTGKIRPFRTSVLADCTANDTSKTAATYKTSYTSQACSLLFILGI